MIVHNRYWLCLLAWLSFPYCKEVVGFEVLGHVTSPEKKPVIGATIHVWTPDPDGILQSVSTQSQKDGSFSLRANGRRDQAVLAITKENSVGSLFSPILEIDKEEFLLPDINSYYIKCSSMSDGKLTEALLAGETLHLSDYELIQMLAVAFKRQERIRDPLWHHLDKVQDPLQFALAFALFGESRDIVHCLSLSPNERLAGNYSKENLAIGSLIEPKTSVQWLLLESALAGHYGTNAHESAKLILFLNGSAKARTMLGQGSEVTKKQKAGDSSAEFVEKETNCKIRHSDLLGAIALACPLVLSGSPTEVSRIFDARICYADTKRAFVYCFYHNNGRYPNRTLIITFKKYGETWHLSSRHDLGSIVY